MRLEDGDLGGRMLVHSTVGEGLDQSVMRVHSALPPVMVRVRPVPPVMVRQSPNLRAPIPRIPLPPQPHGGIHLAERGLRPEIDLYTGEQRIHGVALPRGVSVCAQDAPGNGDRTPRRIGEWIEVLVAAHDKASCT